MQTFRTFKGKTIYLFREDFLVHAVVYPMAFIEHKLVKHILLIMEM